MAVALVIALGVVLVILVGVAGYYARKRRILLWQQTAASLDLQYSTDDPFGLVDMPFDLFSRGDGRGIENVLSGTKDGLDIKAFEFWDYDESPARIRPSRRRASSPASGARSGSTTSSSSLRTSTKQ